MRRGLAIAGFGSVQRRFGIKARKTHPSPPSIAALPLWVEAWRSAALLWYSRSPFPILPPCRAAAAVSFRSLFLHHGASTAKYPMKVSEILGVLSEGMPSVNPTAFSADDALFGTSLHILNDVAQRSQARTATRRLSTAGPWSALKERDPMTSTKRIDPSRRWYRCNWKSYASH